MYHDKSAWVAALMLLTLWVLSPEYSERSRSIPLLLMSWFLVSPGHKQPQYWLCRTNGSLSSARKNFNDLYHNNLNKYYKIYIFLFPQNGLAHKGLIIDDCNTNIEAAPSKQIYHSTYDVMLSWWCNHLRHYCRFEPEGLDVHEVESGLHSASEKLTYNMIKYRIFPHIWICFCYVSFCYGYNISFCEIIWSIYPYPSGLPHWHWGNMIAPVPLRNPEGYG